MLERKEYSVSYWRMFFHQINGMIFIASACLLSTTLLDSLIGVAFLILFHLLIIIPIYYLLFQFYSEDKNKILAINRNKVYLSKNDINKEYEISDIKSIRLIESKAGSKNPIGQFGYIEFKTFDGTKFYITSISANLSRLYNSFEIEREALRVKYPRVGFLDKKTNYNLMFFIQNKNRAIRKQDKNQKFEDLVMVFVNKFDSKDSDKLEQIVLKNELADYAVEASKRILKKRKGNYK